MHVVIELIHVQLSFAHLFDLLVDHVGGGWDNLSQGEERIKLLVVLANLILLLGTKVWLDNHS